MNDTPRTQAVINKIADEGCTNIQPIFDLARTLEREVERLRRELAAARAENEEQARLLGMSGERECDLRGRLERLERELDSAKERLRTEAMDDYSAIKELERDLAAARIKEPK